MMPDINRIGAESAGSYQRTPPPSHGEPRTVRTGAGAKPESGGRTDSVSLSASAQDLRQIAAAILAAPDVREDLVARLQAQVQSGTYQLPSDEALAEALLRGG
jgi:flagellar biosynthesis anti-sigma factor FlgM